VELHRHPQPDGEVVDGAPDDVGAYGTTNAGCWGRHTTVYEEIVPSPALRSQPSAPPQPRHAAAGSNSARPHASQRWYQSSPMRAADQYGSDTGDGHGAGISGGCGTSISLTAAPGPAAARR
jgi:hypothetical protein